MNKKEFLESRPCRRLDWQELEDGHVLVFRPRFGENRLGMWFSSLLGLSDYRIKLDEIGARIWKQCDGTRRANEIAHDLRNQFGKKIEPAEDRLRTFVYQMSRARMVNIEGSEDQDLR